MDETDLSTSLTMEQRTISTINMLRCIRTSRVDALHLPFADGCESVTLHARLRLVPLANVDVLNVIEGLISLLTQTDLRCVNES
jgi:hypothetical protein